MRKLTAILILLFTITLFAQDGVRMDNPNTTPYTKLVVFSFDSDEWVSEWNISKVINEGTKDCLHDWCKKDLRQPSTTSCLVNHDSRGCPDRWGREEWICRKCLRDVIVTENRKIIPPKDKPKTEFEILKEKIKDKK